MDDKTTGFTSVDEYIAAHPKEVQPLLEAMRATIKAAAPDAEEIISYNMPAYAQNGNLVYFSAAKNHIGFYPTPAGIEAFKDELSVYKGAKGSVQFPLDQPLPLELVSRIVEYRVAQNMEKAKGKTRKSK